jgi:filamentous hemagglutinin family protein
MNVPRMRLARGACPCALKLPAAALLAAFSSSPYALPAGEQVTAGSGSVSTSGATMTVQQRSQNLSIDWRAFSIGSGETVRFNQPSASSIALNRVIGNDASAIYGTLSANGQVFLINPNGILFGPGAQVNVGGLVASTLDVAAGSDPANGKYRFASPSSRPASVVNQGTLTANPGGYIALLGGQVSNRGAISAQLGNVSLAAGQAITLDFAGNKLLNLAIDQGTLGALAENRQLIQADGGSVLMTAYARDALLDTVVNNTGVIEARTLQNQTGTIRLMGDFSSGTVRVAGTLDASAPASLNPGGGNGGFIETSGAHVQIADGARITTSASNGRAGTWLIDPEDFTIGAGGDISAATLAAQLAAGNVMIQSANGTVSAGAGNGDVNVNAAVTWNSANTLTLQASRDININAAITGSNGGLTLDAARDINAPAVVRVGTFLQQNGSWRQVGAALPAFSAADFRIAGGTFLRAQGGDGSSANPYLLADIYGVQGIGCAGMWNNSYLLSGDIDASGTAGWNGGAGFAPIASGGTFNGTLDGGNHRINGLRISLPASNDVGLISNLAFGATVKRMGLTSANVTGADHVGIIAGTGQGTISESYATGSVTGNDRVGGLVGVLMSGTLNNVYSEAAVSGQNVTGGLVGEAFQGTISGAYATGAVSAAGGMDGVGGLVGYVQFSTISSAYATGAVTSPGTAGSLFGVAGGNFTHIDAVLGAGAVNGGSGPLIGMDALFPGSVSNAACCVSGAQLLMQSSYPNFDFTNTWSITEGSSMPTLRAIPPPPVPATPANTPAAPANDALAAAPAYNGTVYAGVLQYAADPRNDDPESAKKAKGGDGGLRLTIEGGGIRLPDGVLAQ